MLIVVCILLCYFCSNNDLNISICSLAIAYLSLFHKNIFGDKFSRKNSAVANKFDSDFKFALTSYYSFLVNIGVKTDSNEISLQGISQLERKLEYFVNDENKENYITENDMGVKYLNLDFTEYNYLYTPFHDLFILVKNIVVSNQLSDMEKEKYLEQLRNLSKVELVWLLIFSVSNREIKNNLEILIT